MKELTLQRIINRNKILKITQNSILTIGDKKTRALYWKRDENMLRIVATKLYRLKQLIKKENII